MKAYKLIVINLLQHWISSLTHCLKLGLRFVHFEFYNICSVHFLHLKSRKKGQVRVWVCVGIAIEEIIHIGMSNHLLQRALSVIVTCSRAISQKIIEAKEKQLISRALWINQLEAIDHF